MKIWYAVQIDEDDNDWGTGSYDLEEAKEMAKDRNALQIAVIEEDADSVCVDIIKDFG